MPTIDQSIEFLKHKRCQYGGGAHTNHPVVMEEEAAKRAANKPDETGRRKTKIAWDTRDPEGFAMFHTERERYFRFAGGNPILATEAIVMALKCQPDETIRLFVQTITSLKEKP